VKNLLPITLLSLGVPMIPMGDEVRRTQHGNNNAYCHDNEANWFDWSLAEKHADVRRFVSMLVARRVQRDLTAEQNRVSLIEILRQSKTMWHGVTLLRPDWSPCSHTLALGAEMTRAGMEMHLILSAFWEPLEFELPPERPGRPWRRWIDTALESPDDIVDWQDAPPAGDSRVYRAGPRSVVVLTRRLDPAGRA
jgi:glycogen operon protein